ncbi:MAG TPA: sigma-E factor regulatory protein RseB domain-containing protein [Vicinamibacterales bacterium]|nr:sigma-E factor regulatory protein RseB domain-containing protein [Vicinamibacterales bacterium]
MTSAAVATLVMTVATGVMTQGLSGPKFRGIGVDERLEQPAILAPALDRARIATGTLPAFVRLLIDRDTLQSFQTSGKWEALDARIAIYQQRSVPMLLSIEDRNFAADQGDAWRALTHALATRYRGRVAGYQVELPRGAPRPDPRAYAFVVKMAAVQIRAADPNARIAQATIGPADIEWQTALYAEDTASYVDDVPVDPPDLARVDGVEPLSVVRPLVRARDGTATLITAGIRLDAADERTTARWLAYAFSHLGDPQLRSTVTGSVEAVSAILGVANVLKEVFAGELVTLDPQTVGLTFQASGSDRQVAVPHLLLYSLTNFSTYLAIWGLANESMRVSLVDQLGRAPVARDALRGTVTPLKDHTWDPGTKQARFSTPASSTPLIIDFNYGGTSVYVSRADAAEAAVPSVSEIVFRHQQQQARQDALYSTYIALARMEQHFRPSPTDAFDVVSDNRFYVTRDTVEWEELSFSVNGGKWGPDRPEFPLLQAEKVLSLPFDLQLTADYRYTLGGVDEIGGRRCFVVHFEPVTSEQALYRGRVWIDAETYVRLRLNTIQTRLTPPIVSSEEVQTFTRVAEISEEPVYLATRIATTQLLLIAGRNLLLEKVVTFRDFNVDASDFEARRGAARASDRIMFRDTDAGLRYLVKRGGERVVSDRMTQSSKALAMGTTLDPSFDFPLPIFGLNYLNFNFLGTDSQLALLWGGVLALGNVQKPRLGSTRLDANLDFFAIAVPGNDIVFDAGGERRDERVLTIPLSVGGNLGYQLNAFQKLRLGYQFRYDVFFKDAETAADFTAPPSTATHGGSVEYEFTRRGYTIRATTGLFRRQGWRAWGQPGTFDAGSQSYRRASIGASKDFFLDSFQTVRASAAWYGGSRLDRFSMYQFGLFDEIRMHGVPAAGVRFPALVLLRGSYSVNVLGIYRVDAFVDHARGRDPDDAAVWRPVTGAGLAVNLRAPWRTMLRADVGKSILPVRYAPAGSWVVQVMFLKPLR